MEGKRQGNFLAVRGALPLLLLLQASLHSEMAIGGVAGVTPLHFF